MQLTTVRRALVSTVMAGVVATGVLTIVTPADAATGTITISDAAGTTVIVNPSPGCIDTGGQQPATVHDGTDSPLVVYANHGCAGFSSETIQPGGTASVVLGSIRVATSRQ